MLKTQPSQARSKKGAKPDKKGDNKNGSKKKKLKCYHCGKNRHKKYNCLKSKAENKGKSESKNDDKEKAGSGKSALLSFSQIDDCIADRDCICNERTMVGCCVKNKNDPLHPPENTA